MHSVTGSWFLQVLVFVVSSFISLLTLSIPPPTSWTAAEFSRLPSRGYHRTLHSLEMTGWPSKPCLLACSPKPCFNSFGSLQCDPISPTDISLDWTFYATVSLTWEMLKIFPLPIFFGCCILTATTTRNYKQPTQFNSNMVTVHSHMLHPSKISPRLLILSKV